eukprot:1386215-Prymnesium_polylepis.1
MSSASAPMRRISDSITAFRRLRSAAATATAAAAAATPLEARVNVAVPAGDELQPSFARGLTQRSREFSCGILVADTARGVHALARARVLRQQHTDEPADRAKLHTGAVRCELTRRARCTERSVSSSATAVPCASVSPRRGGASAARAASSFARRASTCAMREAGRRIPHALRARELMRVLGSQHCR